MYCWFLGISVNYVGLTSPPTTCEQFLVTSLMHGPSKCPWFKVTSVYRCFERFLASFQERSEDGVPHQVNYQQGEEHTEDETLSPPYTRSPCNEENLPGLRNCEGGYEAVFPFLPACFHCFSLFFRYTSQSSAKIQTELPVSQPLTKFLGIQTTS